MINKKLYNKLQAQFGNIQIVHENIPATFEITEKTALQGGGYDILIKQRGEQYRVCCPFCGDKKYHLYISHLYGASIRIGNITAHFNKNLAYCFRRNCLSEQKNAELLNNMLYVGLNEIDYQSKSSVNDKIESFTFEPIPDRIPLNHSSTPKNIKEYIINRGLDINELTDLWKVGWGYVPYYEELAIIVPIIQNNTLVGWQARYPGNPPENKAKYYTAKGCKKSQLVYNLDLARFENPVVLVEGVFDVFKIGKRGVCVFGKKPSTIQLKILHAFFKYNEIIWVPDTNDPTALQIAKDAIENLPIQLNIKIKELPIKTDPGDLTREFLNTFIKTNNNPVL